MLYMGDEFSRQTLAEVVQQIRKRTCPDCGEPRPESMQPGETCCQCGHIFKKEELL